MGKNEEKSYYIDVDKAWNDLFARLEKDGLLSDETKNSSSTKRIKMIRWLKVAATICAIAIVSLFFFPQKKDNSMLTLFNKEKSAALVYTLEDGSTVYLASNASISYPSAFSQNDRKVEFSGNALFYIAKDEKRPFIIETNGITIEVVGTIFSVQSSLHSPFELSVKQGKVNVHSRDKQIIVPVEAGESIKQNADGINKYKNENPLIFNRFTDRICFKDEKLINIANIINTLFGSPTIIVEESLNSKKLTVTFENDPVEIMMETICSAFSLEKINKQDTIIIRSSSK